MRSQTQTRSVTWTQLQNTLLSYAKSFQPDGGNKLFQFRRSRPRNLSSKLGQLLNKEKVFRDVKMFRLRVRPKRKGIRLIWRKRQDQRPSRSKRLQSTT